MKYKNDKIIECEINCRNSKNNKNSKKVANFKS